MQRSEDLRTKLKAKKVEVLEGVDSAILMEEARAIMECAASLEEKLTGDVVGLKKDIKNQVSHLQKNIGQVVEVININIALCRIHDLPFTTEIMAPPLPNKYKSLLIPPYNERGDPDDHLEMYTGHMLVHGYS